MTDIKTNLTYIKEQIINSATGCDRDHKTIMLIGVSKRKSAQIMTQGIDAGIENLGENYIQESMEKIDIIGRDKATWHFIGHLQSNKSKFAVRYFDYIHTVDTVKLAKEINKQAKKINKTQKILLQVNIGDEDSKSGSSIDTILDLAHSIADFEHISVKGLMCMPPYFTEPEHSRPYFKKLVTIKNQILETHIPNISMEHLSMGMSNDFKVAIEEGSTMIRVGTSIFGRR
ncbi:MAG: YggS family pyridoxal phosphate-dependent enzyme [Desulfobacteraceae bacterium]|nr:YggS family pyridoxal phosphate-dependent enzyme [Desulfobacteraceae bacterium]